MTKTKVVIYSKGQKVVMARVMTFRGQSEVTIAFNAGSVDMPVEEMVKKFGTAETARVLAVSIGRERWNHGLTRDQAQTKILDWCDRQRRRGFTVYTVELSS